MNEASASGDCAAVVAARAEVDRARELAATQGDVHLPALVATLDHLCTLLDSRGQHDDALAVATEELALCRELATHDGDSFSPLLARGLNTIACVFGSLQRLPESLAAAREAVAVHRAAEQHRPSRPSPDSLICRINLAIALNRLARHDEAMVLSAEAVALCRMRATGEEEILGRLLLAQALDALAHSCGARGRRAEALSASQESVDLHRQLVAAGRRELMPQVASALNNHANWLSDAKRSADAIAAAEESVAVRRELAVSDQGRHLRGLAGALITLGAKLAAAGRLANAIETQVEALTICREFVIRDRRIDLPDIALCLTNLTAVLLKAGRLQEAIDRGTEGLACWRELVAIDRDAYLPRLGLCLENLAGALGESDRHAEGLQLSREAVQVRRELVAAQGSALEPQLASSLTGLAVHLGAAGHRSDAVAAAAEAVDICRRLLAGDRKTFMFDLAVTLLNQGARLAAVDRRFEAERSWRECAMLLLHIAPFEPHDWTHLARGISRELDTWSDLRDWHLPLIRQLVEHRELAYDAEHASLFFGLQQEVASRAWNLLHALPGPYAPLLDELVAALVSALQSPDLARWLEARGDFDEAGREPTAELARIKREVIEAEQLLAALRRDWPDGDGSGRRGAAAAPGADEPGTTLTDDLERQLLRSQALRKAYRDEHARLVAEDPRFAAAFQTFDSLALRSLAGHAQGGALLCVLELGIDGEHSDRDQPFSAERGRAVAALLHADGCRTQLLELEGVHELSWHAQNYRPEALGVSRRGPLRGAPAGATRSVSDGASPPPITDLLAERMSRSFWAPLQQSLQASGIAVERLHVCLHGTTQQLPLALRQAGDCPGLQVIPWPGLPYLRRAAMVTTARSESHTGTDASAPWLIGHDCAWGSEQPLPMVAVEAALLRDLLQRHGQPVQQVRLAAQLHGQASALVACCHGGAEQAQFDHALHLGQEPLTVRQIVQENIGPPLALLPACHAGRTDEDAAGNALGVAAAFMLSGTQVVAASSKAVPDLLQPWLSTLTVWHAMQGLPHHEAATLSRDQLARLDFPDGYRSWLQQALPQALATIQPGGEEDEHIRGVHAQVALEQVEERWPWEGQTKDLFSAEASRREEATRSVVQGILVPRGGEAGARALAAEAREMAAFVFVYGVNSTSGCVRHAPDQDAGRAVSERMN